MGQATPKGSWQSSVWVSYKASRCTVVCHRTTFRQ